MHRLERLHLGGRQLLAQAFLLGEITLNGYGRAPAVGSIGPGSFIAFRQGYSFLQHLDGFLHEGFILFGERLILTASRRRASITSGAGLTRCPGGHRRRRARVDHSPEFFQGVFFSVFQGDAVGIVSKMGLPLIVLVFVYFRQT